MSIEHIGTKDKLTSLINLLSCNDLDVHEVNRIVDICLQAQEDPGNTLAANYGSEAAQLVKYDAEGIIAFIIFLELEDYFAVSDTVDELYEEIVAAFETPALPEYPYDDNNFETLSDYYRWLEEQLLAQHPRYRLISFGQSYTHDFQVILVFRADVDQILGLCKDLGLQAQVCQ